MQITTKQFHTDAASILNARADALYGPTVTPAALVRICLLRSQAIEHTRLAQEG